MLPSQNPEFPLSKLHIPLPKHESELEQYCGRLTAEIAEKLDAITKIFILFFSVFI